MELFPDAAKTAHGAVAFSRGGFVLLSVRAAREVASRAGVDLPTTVVGGVSGALPPGEPSLPGVTRLASGVPSSGREAARATGDLKVVPVLSGAGEALARVGRAEPAGASRSLHGVSLPMAVARPPRGACSRMQAMAGWVPGRGVLAWSSGRRLPASSSGARKPANLAGCRRDSSVRLVRSGRFIFVGGGCAGRSPPG